MSFLDGISANSTSTATASTSSSTESSEDVSSDAFDDYLTLLLVELENQDPTEPVDSSSINDELVSYEQLAAQEENNELLNQLILDMQESSSGDTAQQYLGQDIVAEGSQAPLEHGDAEWYVATAEGATTMSITITDENGQVVYKDEMDVSGGDTENLVWDGVGDDGTQYDPGLYNLNVTARDADGKTVDSEVYMTGKVSAVDLSGDEPMLFVNGVDVGVNQVQGVLASN